MWNENEKLRHFEIFSSSNKRIRKVLISVDTFEKFIYRYYVVDVEKMLKTLLIMKWVYGS